MDSNEEKKPKRPRIGENRIAASSEGETAIYGKVESDHSGDYNQTVRRDPANMVITTVLTSPEIITAITVRADITTVRTAMAITATAIRAATTTVRAVITTIAITIIKGDISPVNNIRLLR